MAVDINKTDKKEISQVAIRELLDEAVNIQNTGVDKNLLNQKNIQDAKEYYPYWLKLKKESNKYITIAYLIFMGAILANIESSFEFIVLIAFAFFVLAWFKWELESNRTNYIYVYELLGKNLTQLKDKKSFYINGLTIEIFGRVEQFNSKSFLFHFAVLAVLVFAGIVLSSFNLKIAQLLVMVSVLFGAYVFIKDYKIKLKKGVEK